MADLSARRCNPGMCRTLKAAGKPPKVVLVACMRKLLTIMNTLLKNHTPWRSQGVEA
jgi:transposase